MLAEDGRVGYDIPSSGVVLEGCQHGARKVDTQAGRSHAGLLLYCLASLNGWLTKEGILKKNCRGSLASSSLEALVGVARSMEIVASAAR